MMKCDFCKKSMPNGECTWLLAGSREADCEKAIKRMVEALGQEPKKAKRSFGNK